MLACCFCSSRTTQEAFGVCHRQHNISTRPSSHQRGPKLDGFVDIGLALSELESLEVFTIAIHSQIEVLPIRKCVDASFPQFVSLVKSNHEQSDIEKFSLYGPRVPETNWMSTHRIFFFFDRRRTTNRRKRSNKRNNKSETGAASTTAQRRSASFLFAQV